MSLSAQFRILSPFVQSRPLHRLSHPFAGTRKYQPALVPRSRRRTRAKRRTARGDLSRFAQHADGAGACRASGHHRSFGDRRTVRGVFRAWTREGAGRAGRAALHVRYGGGELLPRGVRGRRLARAAAAADSRSSRTSAGQRGAADHGPGQALRRSRALAVRRRSPRSRRGAAACAAFVRLPGRGHGAGSAPGTRACEPALPQAARTDGSRTSAGRFS